MFCEKCGNQMPDDSKFCLSCGAPTAGEEAVREVTQEITQEAAAAVDAAADVATETMAEAKPAVEQQPVPVQAAPAQPAPQPQSAPVQPAPQQAPVQPAPTPVRPAAPQASQQAPVQPTPNQYYQQPAAPQKPEKIAPLKTWKFIGMFILAGIPLIGFIMILVWSFSDAFNKNTKSFARAILILWIIGLILAIIGVIVNWATIQNLIDFFNSGFSFTY